MRLLPTLARLRGHRSLGGHSFDGACPLPNTAFPNIALPHPTLRSVAAVYCFRMIIGLGRRC